MLDKKLEEQKKQKEALRIILIEKKKTVEDLAELFNIARSSYNKHAKDYEKLDRKIFEKTKGITTVGKKAKKKIVPKTLEELNSEERETLLKQLLEIQARRRDGKS